MTETKKHKVSHEFVISSAIVIVAILGIANYWLFAENSSQYQHNFELAIEEKLNRIQDLGFHFIVEYETEQLRQFQRNLEKEYNTVYVIIKNNLTNVAYGSYQYQPGADIKEYRRDIQVEEAGPIYGQIKLGVNAAVYNNSIRRSFYFFLTSYIVSIIFIVGFLYLFFKKDVAPKIARFEAALDSSNESIYLLDSHNFHIVDSNRAGWLNLGYARSEILHKSFCELCGEQDSDEFLRKLNEASTHRNNPIVVDSTHYCKDGQSFPIEIRLSPFSINGQDMLVAVIRDMTERLEYERQLVFEKERAEKGNKAKTEFLSHMSHELRTPLNSILGFSQLLRVDTEQPLSDSQRISVEEISHAGQHLLDLINEILDLAKIESGTLNVDVQAVDIQEMFLTCLNLMQPQAEQRNVELIYDFESQSYIILADSVRLKEVLINIISNAIKYNKEQGKVFISSESIGERFLRIKIRDTGYGISEEYMDKVFIPFERNGAEKAGIDGVGIGLSLSKKLVELMGGKIDFSSENGEGCTFWIDIPMAQETYVAEPGDKRQAV